ncbi:conjugal transfer protein, partial [Escherichia coli]|nr:conjugal transfer protein [Escherichia coli]
MRKIIKYIFPVCLFSVTGFVHAEIAGKG